MQSLLSAEFFKYRRKSTDSLILLLILLYLNSACRGQEVYQCNNETQTCITEAEQQQQSDQQFNLPLPIISPNEQHQTCRGKVILNQPHGFISDGPGNYSLDAKCTWVVQSPNPNSTIRLQLLEFATECSWDHLYIFDGDSVLAPLLAVFSGLTLSRDYRLRELNQVVSSSSIILLHFYSDLAYNMSGFNISFSINSCLINERGQSCSGHGVCIEGSCTCDAGYHGSDCQHEICPQNCSKHGFCNMELHGCVCDEGWSGLDCGQPRESGFWSSVWSEDVDHANSSETRLALARSQGSGAVWKGVLWVVGGHSLDINLPFTMAFNISGNEWSRVETSGAATPSTRYGHSSVIHEGILYMYGGATADGSITSQLWTLNLTSKEWNLQPLFNIGVSNCHHRSVSLCAGPVATSGHSAVLVKDKMYVIFGYNPVYGYLNWIQEYAIDSRQWSVVATTGALVQGSYGHSSVWDPLTKRIYVYGGYQSESSSTYGLTDAFYSFEPTSKVWRTHPSSGSYRYLHSAVMSGGLMLVYGGNTHNETAMSNGAKCYSSDFIAYDTVCDSWYRLHQPSAASVGGDLPRYGHLAASFGPTADLDSNDDKHLHSPLLPYGMLIFGGFDGQLKSDVLVYVVGVCTSINTKEQCLTAMSSGVKCVWNKAAKKCEPLTSISKEGYEKCPVLAAGDSVTSLSSSDWPTAISATPLGFPLNYTSLCSSISSCPTCLHTTFNCVWCGHSCQYAKCKEGSVGLTPPSGGLSKAVAITSVDQCEIGDANSCRLLHSCSACHTEAHCRWEQDARCYTYARKVGNKTEKVEIVKDDQMCDVPCSWRTSCRNCTQGPCLWCTNQNRCVDKNAYIPSFPYGLCTEWTTQETKCREPDFTDWLNPLDQATSIRQPAGSLGANVYTKMTTCRVYRSCSECLEDPACGWCDDGSKRGTGTCMPGGYRGPLSSVIPTVMLRSDRSKGNGSTSTGLWTCPASQWFFTECPPCQCNGHSTCSEASRHLCNQPCLHLTEGPHCETCIPGYFGNPINGGTCSPCQCSGHGTQCHQLSGRCFCTTKGVVGDHCERCDVANHYTSGLLTLLPGTTNSSFLHTCYYELQLDFQFTFNLSKKEDRHIRQINFRNMPLKPDLDLEFSVSCSSWAKLNISVRSNKVGPVTGEDGSNPSEASVPGEERFLLVNRNFTAFKWRFLRSDYQFGSEENTTFYVYVYDFRSPIWIQVSFSQHPKLELQQFFITFSACFISLLLVAAIMWKIKQKYDLYRRRQRLFVEMEQMASRPFSHVFVELQVPPSFSRKAAVIYSNNSPQVTDDNSTSEASNRSKIVVNVNSQNNSSMVETSFSSNANPSPHTSSGQPQAIRRRRRFRPSPIALEPCADQKAAVLSLLIRLPNGTLPYTPPGQSGLAIASTLVSLGPYASRKSNSTVSTGSESRDPSRNSMPKAKSPPTMSQMA